jgi:hypothetical protein
MIFWLPNKALQGSRKGGAAFAVRGHQLNCLLRGQAAQPAAADQLERMQF